MIGSAGSFETLIDVLKNDLQEPIIPISKHASEVSLDSFFRFVELITRLNSKERAQLKGMVDFRVEMIVVASILMDVVVKRFKITRIIASNYSLKEGMLFSQCIL
jgi:exopolyphosphatase/guanosine-5'-triphosphate,3'-diphosphate pyrophosphatase